MLGSRLMFFGERNKISLTGFYVLCASEVTESFANKFSVDRVKKSYAASNHRNPPLYLALVFCIEIGERKAQSKGIYMFT